MEEALEQPAQITNRRSFLGVLNVPLASELTTKRTCSCNPALAGQNVYYVHSDHIIHVSLVFRQLFSRIIGNSLE